MCKHRHFHRPIDSICAFLGFVSPKHFRFLPQRWINRKPNLMKTSLVWRSLVKSLSHVFSQLFGTYRVSIDHFNCLIIEKKNKLKMIKPINLMNFSYFLWNVKRANYFVFWTRILSEIRNKNATNVIALSVIHSLIRSSINCVKLNFQLDFHVIEPVNSERVYSECRRWWNLCIN